MFFTSRPNGTGEVRPDSLSAYGRTYGSGYGFGGLFGGSGGSSGGPNGPCIDNCDDYVDSSDWAFVGDGRGDYRKVPNYTYVGEGQGSFELEQRQVYYGWRLRSSCVWCLACVLFLAAAVILWRSSWGPPPPPGPTPAPTPPPPSPPPPDEYDCECEVAANPEAAWGRTDRDGDGIVRSLDLMVAQSKGELTAGQLKVLRVSDYDGDGVLSRQEFEGAITKANAAVTTTCDVSRWSPARRGWCCANRNVGCRQGTTTTTTAQLYDCSDGALGAWEAWKAPKKAWCCGRYPDLCHGRVWWTTTGSPTTSPDPCPCRSTTTTGGPPDPTINCQDSWNPTWVGSAGLTTLNSTDPLQKAAEAVRQHCCRVQPWLCEAQKEDQQCACHFAAGFQAGREAVQAAALRGGYA